MDTAQLHACVLHIVTCGNDKLTKDEKYLAEWLEHLAVSAKIATILGSISASSDTVESEGRHMKQC
jgi:hypothetical protein